MHGLLCWSSALLMCVVRHCPDVLLCHDDELEGRRIAFIFYLVPEWTKEDGGEMRDQLQQQPVPCGLESLCSMHVRELTHLENPNCMVIN